MRDFFKTLNYIYQEGKLNRVKELRKARDKRVKKNKTSKNYINLNGYKAKLLAMKNEVKGNGRQTNSVSKNTNPNVPRTK